MIIISAEWGWGFRDAGRNCEKEGESGERREVG